jgi:hypothetical protein
MTFIKLVDSIGKIHWINPMSVCNIIVGNNDSVIYLDNNNVINTYNNAFLTELESA